MHPFLVWLLEAVGVLLIALMNMERYQPHDPAVRYAVIVFGALLFMVGVLYTVIARLRNVMHTVPALQKGMRRVMKQYPQDVKKWNTDIYAHRVKYFFLSLLFTAVAVGFLLIGIYMQTGWASPVHRIIEMILAGIFVLIGGATMMNYLVMIVRGKSK